MQHILDYNLKRFTSHNSSNRNMPFVVEEMNMRCLLVVMAT